MGSLIHPSIGIALSVDEDTDQEHAHIRFWGEHTFVKDITHWAVVENHDFTQIGLYLAKVLDVGAIAEGAMLAVISAAEVFTFAFEPVNNGVCVFLHGSCEDDKIVPLAHLQ